MKILGVDPGSIYCGYGVIDYDGRVFTLREAGCVDMKKLGSDLPKKLLEIYMRVCAAIERNKPDCAAFESLFYFKNAQSLMKLSHARAAAILAAAEADLPIFEYSAREVKKAVTGRGNASKEQVRFMTEKILNSSKPFERYDVTDALAVAVCRAVKSGNAGLSSGASKGGWAQFVKDNPDRIVKP